MILSMHEIQYYNGPQTQKNPFNLDLTLNRFISYSIYEARIFKDLTCGNSYNITKFSDFMEINLNIYHGTSTIKSQFAVQISKSI